MNYELAVYLKVPVIPTSGRNLFNSIGMVIRCYAFQITHPQPPTCPVSIAGKGALETALHYITVGN